MLNPATSSAVGDISIPVSYTHLTQRIEREHVFHHPVIGCLRSHFPTGITSRYNFHQIRTLSLIHILGALGGDISVISSNPAGIGIFRSNDVSISFTLMVIESEIHKTQRSIVAYLIAINLSLIHIYPMGVFKKRFLRVQAVWQVIWGWTT